MNSKPPRPITAVDRVLAYGDQLAVAAGDPVRARRRTHRRCGQLDVIVVETAGESTTVYLTHAAMDSAIIEVTVAELDEAAAVVRELMTKPPPVKRKR
jgi:hypothetical protein